MSQTRQEASRTRIGAPGIRTRLVALAVVLIALWSYAAYLTGRDAADLLRVRALAETFGQPTDRLILDLQAERRLTAEAIAGAGQARDALAGARDGTDRAVATLRASTDGNDLRLLTAGAVRTRVDELTRQLGGLNDLRAEADTGRPGAVSGYDRLIDTAFAVYGPEWGARESELAAETRAVVALARSRELLAREDTLLTAALAGGRITADDRRRLAELASNQRYARSEAVAGLPAADRDSHQRLAEGPRFAALLALEDRLLRGDGGPAVTVADWRAVADPALSELHEFVKATARGSVERATPGAALVVARTGAVLGLGLITVLALLATWAGTVRRLVDRLDRIDRPAEIRSAEPLTGPPVDGRHPDPEPDAPPGLDGRPGPDAAARHVPGPAGPQGGAGVDPAGVPGRDDGAAERATGELFLRLTQRNQTLLRDQLTLLDAMERRDPAAEESSDMFQLDHLATRIRRNVEKLITIAGATPARRWRRPVPLLDVARGAVAEVADYHRVLVAPYWPWSLAGPAVTDVVHLLAELIENALVFSPGSTTVRVAGEPGSRGCSIVVTDDGPGLDAAALAEANDLLDTPPPAGPPAGRAGLYAAARLAASCGAQVSLHPGPRGGTAAVVLLPANLVTPTGPDRATAGPIGPAHLPGRSTTAPGADHGQLPVRPRHSGPVPPGPGTDTVELPVPRAARGR